MSAYSFSKLFSGITESTVWCEPLPTRVVWITLLAKCDRHGRFTGSLPGLARLANVSLDEAVAAIETLLAPDPYSRTTDHEGRRIEPIDGGWRLLNHAKYRDMRDEDVRRQQNRDSQRRRRERLNGVSETADSQQAVSSTPHLSAHADADAKQRENSPSHACARAAAIVQALSRAGVTTSTSDTRVHEAVAAGVTPEIVHEIIEAHGSSAHWRQSPGYILTIATRGAAALRSHAEEGSS